MSSTNRIARQASLMEQALLWTVRGVNRGQAADRTLQNWFHQRKYLGSRDRRFIRDAVFACWRRYGWLSKWEDAPVLKQAALAWRLQLGALPEPLYDAGLELPDLPGNLHDLPLAEQARILTDTGILAVAPQELLPIWGAELVGEEAFPNLCNALVHRPPTWLRAAGGNARPVEEWLVAQKADIVARDSDDALAVREDRIVHELSHSTSVSAEVQDLASQAVVRFADPTKGATWWDICAGAGGKSLHLADRVGSKGRVLATDPRREAVEEARRRLKRSRHNNVDLRTGSAETATLPAGVVLNGVLVDAPCSGSGVWARQPDGPWRMSRRQVRKQSETQLELLKAASAHVPTGAHLVYAVCSVFPMEGIEVVTAFEAAHPEFTRVPAPHPLNPKESTDGAVLIQPQPGVHDGMFMARWVKG